VSNRHTASAKRNSSYSTYSILFITYTSYFGGKKGISRNKMIFFFLMPTTLALAASDGIETTNYAVYARHAHMACMTPPRDSTLLHINHSGFAGPI